MPVRAPQRPDRVDADPAKLVRLKTIRARIALARQRVIASRPPRPRPWHNKARADQIPPAEGDWLIYLALAGRGWGKTESGAQWLAEQAVRNPGTEWAAISPVWRDCKTTLFEGKSGLLQAFLPDEVASFNASDLILRLLNGSVIFGFGAERPDRIRGKNLSGGWVDELAAMPKAEELWDEALMPAVRIGEYPRVFVTTTPKPTPMVKRLVKRATVDNDGSIILVRGRTRDNEANLSRRQLAELELRYAGTRIGRQELEGELLDDVEGALWTRELIERGRIPATELPPMVRIVVAIDPAVTSGENADWTGIVVVGRSRDNHLYVLADYTMRGTPNECMSKAVVAYHTHKADRVVAEVNNGGDYVGEALRQVDKYIAYSAVRATRGKQLRAEPTAAIWEQGRGHIVGSFTDLEDQMATWTVDAKESPDRLDALVWACTELMTGASSQAYLSAISVTCPKCDFPNKKGATRCRACNAEIPAEPK